GRVVLRRHESGIGAEDQGVVVPPFLRSFMNHAVGCLFGEGALKAEQVAGDPLTLTVPPVHDVAHSGYGALGSIAVACAVIGFDDQTPRPPLPRWPFVPPSLVRASSSSAACH